MLIKINSKTIIDFNSILYVHGICPAQPGESYALNIGFKDGREIFVYTTGEEALREMVNTVMDHTK